MMMIISLLQIIILKDCSFVNIFYIIIIIYVSLNYI